MSPSGIITTVAGNGTAGYSGDNGLATSAELNYPFGVALDASGNIYIADEGNQRIRMVNPSGVITTVAGNGPQGYSGDNGPATSAELAYPPAVAVDASGNLYIADAGNQVIRKVTAATGIITTVAGNGHFGYTGDNGLATNAELAYPSGMALDASGNLYITDEGNNVIRKVNPTGTITTVAGNGLRGYTGDNGAATSAELFGPNSVAVDASGNLYIADTDNRRTRKVGPSGIITTVAGDGIAGYSGDNGPATSAELAIPSGIALGASGNLYIADQGNQRIREVSVGITAALSFATTQVSSQSTDSPQGFQLSNIGNSALTISIPSTGTNPSIASGFTYDASSSCPQLSMSSSTYSLDSGTSCSYALDFIPVANGVDNGSLVLSDNSLNNSGSRQIISLSGVGTAPVVTVTLAPTSLPGTTAGSPYSQTIAASGGTAPYTYAVTTGALPSGLSFSLTGLLSGTPTAAGTFNFTVQATDSLGVVGTQAYSLIVVLPTSYTAPTEPVGTPSATQTATLLFSSGFTLGSIQVVTQGATGLDFNYVGGGTCAVGTVYTAGQTCAVNYTFTPKAPGPRYGAIEILDNRSNLQANLYLNGTGTGPLVNFLPGTQSTLGSGFNQPRGVAVDSSGNVFVADTFYHQVQEILAAGGYTTINTLGSGFGYPEGVALDGSGNVFVADAGNNAVYEIVAAGGYTTVNTLASGSGLDGPTGVAVDGSGNVFVADFYNNAVKEILAAGGYTTINTLGSGFNLPFSVAVDSSGNVFVADAGNNAVKEIMAAGGYTTVNTVGSGFSSPSGVAVDGNGNVFVADTSNNAVKKILAVGGYTTVDTVSLPGSGFIQPFGVAVDGSGNVYVADTNNGAVDKLDFADPPSVVFPTTTQAGSIDTTDGPMPVTVENIGNASLTAVAPGLTAPADFTQVAGSGTPPDCTASFSLAAGASCNLSIEFAPVTPGALSESFVLTDNNLNGTNTTQNISLSGIGVQLTQTIIFSPIHAAVLYGVAPITLSATGGASGNPVTFRILSGPGSVTGGNMLAFTGTGTVVVAADQLGNLGYLAAPEVTQAVVVLPTSYTAPAEPVATPSATQTATLLFSSGFTLGSIQVVTQGATGLDFNYVGGGTCAVGTVYTAGQTCTVSFTFTPKAPGPRYGAIEILDNSSNLQTTLYINGTGTGPLVNFLPGTQSTLGVGFGEPENAVVDASEDIFVADADRNAVYEVVAVNGSIPASPTVNTLGGGFNFNGPTGVAVDGSGNVFVAGYNNNAVYEIVAAGGYTTVNTLGSGFNRPFAVAVDGSGNVFVADTNNSAVKEIVAAGGYTTINTLGSGFNAPFGVAVDGSGNVFVADTYNSAVKEIVAVNGSIPASPTINTLGSGFDLPFGVAVDGNANVFVADTYNGAVKQIVAAGGYTTVNTLGSDFDGPRGVAVDERGNVFVADFGNHAMEKLDYADPPSLAFSTATLAFAIDSTDGPMSVTVENGGNAALTAVAPGLTAPADFTQVAGSGTPPDCTATFSLAAGASCRLGVEFAPKAAGMLNESFVLTDNSLNVATATQSISLSGTGEAIGTTTALASSLNPSSYGQPVTITATVAPASGTTAPSGTVQFSVDGSPAGSAVTLNSGTAVVTSSTFAAGAHNIAAAFTPGTGSAFIASSSVALSQVVNQAVPTVSFTGALANAPYESTFTVAASTNASTTAVITASGSCSITGATVTITAPSGTCSLTAMWAADNNYLAASAVQVSAATKATPTVNWATPAAITYGAALTATHLDATATYNGTTVAGTFVYTPAKGTVLNAGTQILSVTFTPNNPADYTNASGSVTLQVNQATPKITWAKPAAITYGTVLSSTQLDATASIPGTVAYSAAAGSTLTAGSQTLSVTFTPTDTVDYMIATDSVTITVKQAAPTVTWVTPAAITYGTALSSTQLDATASVPGSFVYSPAAGAIEGGGSDKLSVTFTPTDGVDYTTSTASVMLHVNPATPTINWSTPAAIIYGTALTATQLDATATYNGSAVAGTFVYTPAKGTVPAAGTQTLSVTFTPTNTTNYAAPPSVSIALQVLRAMPKITWAKPAAITYGTALSATQLDATASVGGTFAYSPAVGTVLVAGLQPLSVTFTPTDTTDYTTATDSVTITISTATSTTTITSNTPNPAAVGEVVTVDFSVTGMVGVPTGSVTVTASTGESCSGSLGVTATGNCTLTFTATGSPRLTATYGGDGNFKSSSSAKVTETVN